MNETFTHCPKCQYTHFVKAGFNNGRQRYKCKGCSHYFSVQKPVHHKSDETKQMAINMYLEGLGFRAIGRLLGVSHQTVYKWVKRLGEQHQAKIDDNQEIDLVELDEIHSYTKHKKLLLDLDCHQPTHKTHLRLCLWQTRHPYFYKTVQSTKRTQHQAVLF